MCEDVFKGPHEGLSDGTGGIMGDLESHHVVYRTIGVQACVSFGGLFVFGACLLSPFHEGIMSDIE